MQLSKIKAEIKEFENKQELTVEEKKRLAGLRTQEEAKKRSRPTTNSMKENIMQTINKVNNIYEPAEARLARAQLGVFLRELAAHTQGRQMQVTRRVQDAMKEKRQLKFRSDDIEILARAAINYEISFGRVSLR